MAEDKATLEKRKLVIDKARSQVGAHYLLGTRGQMPGQGDLAMLPNVLNPPGEQVLFTAANEKNRCSGRHGHRAVKLLPIGDPGQKRHLVSPAKYKWHRVVTWKYVNKLYGECCKDKAHFDCIGLINWCLRDINRRVFYKNLSISEVRALCEAVNKGGVNHADLCAADILIRKDNGHIGLAVGGGSDLVVQAEYEATGVVVGPVGQWTFHGRLPRSFWEG